MENLVDETIRHPLRGLIPPDDVLNSLPPVLYGRSNESGEEQNVPFAKYFDYDVTRIDMVSTTDFMLTVNSYFRRGGYNLTLSLESVFNSTLCCTPQNLKWTSHMNTSYRLFMNGTLDLTTIGTFIDASAAVPSRYKVSFERLGLRDRDFMLDIYRAEQMMEELSNTLNTNILVQEFLAHHLLDDDVNGARIELTYPYQELVNGLHVDREMASIRANMSAYQPYLFYKYRKNIMSELDHRAVIRSIIYIMSQLVGQTSGMIGEERVLFPYQQVNMNTSPVHTLLPAIGMTPADGYVQGVNHHNIYSKQVLRLLTLGWALSAKFETASQHSDETDNYRATMERFWNHFDLSRWCLEDGESGYFNPSSEIYDLNQKYVWPNVFK